MWEACFTKPGCTASQDWTPWLWAMFSGHTDIPTDTGGWVLMDPSSHPFGTILNYLWDWTLSLPDRTRELGELVGKPRYYVNQAFARRRTAH